MEEKDNRKKNYLGGGVLFFNSLYMIGFLVNRLFGIQT